LGLQPTDVTDWQFVNTQGKLAIRTAPIRPNRVGAQSTKWSHFAQAEVLRPRAGECFQSVVRLRSAIFF
jgi:hypothetical protein